jgi:integration host factor subunit alpha
MRKADIARRIHQRVGISEKEAADLLDWILRFLTSTLQRGEPIAISGFGRLTVREKRPRNGRNPQTGEELMIAARRVITFHPSPLLKDEVNSAQAEQP